MSGDFALLVGGLFSAFGLGFACGRTVKAVRQFFNLVG